MPTNIRFTGNQACRRQVVLMVFVFQLNNSLIQRAATHLDYLHVPRLQRHQTKQVSCFDQDHTDQTLEEQQARRGVEVKGAQSRFVQKDHASRGHTVSSSGHDMHWQTQNSTRICSCNRLRFACELRTQQSLLNILFVSNCHGLPIQCSSTYRSIVMLMIDEPRESREKDEFQRHKAKQ